jgi:hypothetical protein
VARSITVRYVILFSHSGHVKEFDHFRAAEIQILTAVMPLIITMMMMMTMLLVITIETVIRNLRS